MDSVGEICNREVVCAERATPVTDAAKLMREHHVGCLVVVDEGPQGRVPVGILTDRDIVVAVIARGVDPATLRVADVMGQDLFTVRESDSVFDALARMRGRGVRRVPVVSAVGTLAGLVTVDDLLSIVAEEIGSLVQAIGAERAREAKVRKGATG